MLNRIVPLVLGLAGAALGHTVIVTTVQDVVDPGDGVQSLREAIIAANNNVNAAGQCNGVTNIHFSLSGTNAVATYGDVIVPYYKLKINYHDPEYASVMNFTPRPTTLPHVRCPINLDGYTQPGVRPNSPLIEISGEDLPLIFASTPPRLLGTDAERSFELLTLHGRLVRQLEAGPTLVGCRQEDPGCPLKRTANGSTIRGILFNHAPQHGLALVGAENVTITGNYFGLDATGETPAPNGRRPDNQHFSLLLNGASSNTIGTPKEPNYFGVNRSHSIMLWPFTGSGECGETSPADATCGRMDIGSSDNVIQSNYFGLNKGGKRSLGGICVRFASDRRLVGESGCEPGLTRESAIHTNGGPHIYVNFWPGGVPVSRNSLRRNRIGGLKPGEGNVFVAAWSGVHVKAVDTEVLGNIFGLDAKGVGATEIGPFFRSAVILQTDATGTRVEGNIIANTANYFDLRDASLTYGYGGGVHVQGNTGGGSGFTDDLPPNIVARNNIGANVHRQHPGDNLLGLPAGNAGGGVTSTWMLPITVEDNLIAYNGYLGTATITARTNQTFRQRRFVVLGNSMYCNGAVVAGQTCGSGMGIDWHATDGFPTPLVPTTGGDGPTLNDDGDLDDGPAELQNFPVLTAMRGGVTGRLSSKPNKHYRIQVFSSSLVSAACVAVTSTLQAGFVSDPACANSGVSPAFLVIQGDTLLRELDVRTDSNGVADFSLQTPSNSMIAATATELSEDGRPLHTSELSQAVSTRQP
jgi:hypothetical protein